MNNNFPTLFLKNITHFVSGETQLLIISRVFLSAPFQRKIRGDSEI